MPNLPQNADIGSSFGAVIDLRGLTDAFVLDLIRYYNDDFEIAVGDDLFLRAQKLRHWLTE